MKDKIVEFTNAANERTRGAVTQAASLLADAKGPIKTTAKFANSVNDINHRCIKKIVEFQAKALQGSVDDGIKRLKTAAASNDIKSFYTDQYALFPANRDRVVAELRTGFDILRNAAGEVKGLVVDTVNEFRGTSPAAKRRTKTTAKKDSSATA